MVKAIILASVAAVSLSTAAFAQSTTVVRTEGEGGSKTVVRSEGGDGTVVKKKVVRTGALGCRKVKVKKTNAMGDSVTKTKSSC